MQSLLSHINPTRAKLYVAASLVVMLATFVVGVRGWTQFFLLPNEANGEPVRLFTNTDYPAIALASRLVASGRGGELYDLNVQRREQDALASEGYLYLPQGQPLKYPYPYTPFIAVLWSLLSGVSPLVGMALWDLLNIAGLAGGLWYLLASLSLPAATRVLLLLAALTSFPFIVNLEQGQSSGVVMLALGVGIGLLRRGKDLRGGLILGLLALKLQWLLFPVALLLWKLRWRALLGVAITGASLTSLALLTMGMGWIPGFLGMVNRVGRWDRALLLDPWYSHSVSGGLRALLGPGTDDLVRTLTLLATLLLAVALALIWRGTWQPGSPHWDGAMALTLLVAIFTNLQVNTHDLVLLVVPGALGLSYLNSVSASGRLRPAWYALLWASYIVPAFFLDIVFKWPLRLTPLVIALMLALIAIASTRKDSSAVSK